MTRSLRFVLLAAGVALLVMGGFALRAWLQPEIAYVPLDSPEGFRRVRIEGRASAVVDTLVGFTDAPAAPPEDLCEALFGPALAAPVPVAVFSDVACPFCGEVERRLRELDDRSEFVSVVRREWPILRPSSERAARAILAAEAQGAGRAMAERLQGSAFLPTPAYLTDVAAGLGLDAARLLEDLGSSETDRRLAASAALAETFRFAGTPGLVIGRTALEGAVSMGLLERLVAAERDAGPPPCAA